MSTTTELKTDTLKVPGASIYYEVRGSGPVLLMMPGGPATAGAFGRIAGELARHFTVVTYDPRGLSHSKIEGPCDDTIEVFADDIHRLLAQVGTDKAFVFASSGGALIALELARRHPEQLATVVCHEPPSPALQPDPAVLKAQMDDVYETYRAAGLWPAVQKFMALAGPPPAQQAQPGEPTPEMQAAMAEMQRNLEVFLGHYFHAIASYEPDIAALKAASCRIVPACGAESTGEFAHQGALGLADKLGTNAEVFPGGHGGFDTHATEFAVRLGEVLL